MPWNFALTADATVDLDVLRTVFPSGDPMVKKTEEGHELLTDSIDPAASAGDAFRRATELLQQMTGFARTVDLQQGECRLEGTYASPAGDTGTVAAAATIHSRARVFPPSVTVGGNEAAPPLGPRIVQLAATDQAVADLLQLVSTHPRDWITLYKLYEIVRAEVGRDGIESRGWATAADLDRFTASANHPGVSGLEARHARLAGSSPTRTMALDTAINLMSTVTNRFLVDRATT